jgi:hypothetical protein
VRIKEAQAALADAVDEPDDDEPAEDEPDEDDELDDEAAVVAGAGVDDSPEDFDSVELLDSVPALDSDEEPLRESVR